MTPPAACAPNTSCWRIRRRILSGLLVLIPLAVTWVVINWILQFGASQIRPLARYFVAKGTPDNAFEITVAVYVCAIAGTVILLYLMGWITSRVFGKRLLAMGESLLERIPLVKSIYSGTKNIVEMVSKQDRSAFKQTLLVDFPRPGIKAIAFLTSTIRDPSGKVFCTVFLPTTPNPTSGYLLVVPAEEVQVLELSIDVAIKMVVSGGILSPATLDLARPYGLPPPSPAPGGNAPAI